jgi:6-pyruvoyltetrahydropterin/6-carboxytetrahydropterin synthase
MHRIPNHEGSCKAFHGHRYVAEFTCAAPRLDALGRVVDFSVLKSLLGGWINEHFDHTAIFDRSDCDPAAIAVARSNAEVGRPVYLMDCPPTAENIAVELGHIAIRLLQPHGICVRQVTVWETPNCCATWTAEAL